jgi:hypothetical protein
MGKPHIPAPPPTRSPWQQEQAATLKIRRERLLAEDSDIATDPDLWRDTLDGESDAIDLAPSRDCRRAERAERRKQAFRAAAFALMDIAGFARLPEPDFVARIQPGQPHLANSTSTRFPRTTSTSR